MAANRARSVIEQAGVESLLAEVMNRWKPAKASIFLPAQQALDLPCGLRPAGIETIATLSQRLDLAVLLAADATVPERSLAALRDRWASITLALLPVDDNSAAAAKTEQQMRALAFTPYAQTHSSAVRAYVFNIASYKPTPDWFNAKGWANPENWDKYRW